ncbi:LysR family transcriptional regulator [Paenibacillus sp. Marseille-Q4541]|uniref:LysR family transcriptional regulator n=1 Tax=Paenibacillus sp. Marseille-Q4541 TaxID=2831522 RepID=UPI001BAA32B4|nr:LysR family transcriptional regulator [Paenibacillus sp. Marseille-Q4541]
MNFDQLLYISETAKTGSLTKAAESCNVTLSAVSQSITSLENELGFPLFKRSRAGAVPTEDGKRILSKAYRVLDAFDELKKEAQDRSEQLTGVIRLATIPLPTLIYTDAIIDFNKKFPDVTLELFEMGTHDIIQEIKADRLDVGLIIFEEELTKQHSSLLFGKLIKQHMVVGVSRQSPLALQNSITPEEILKYPVVLYKDELLQKFYEDLQQTYGKGHLLFSTNQTSVIQKIVREDVAITIGFDLSFSKHADFSSTEIVTLPLAIPEMSSSYVGWVQPNKRNIPKQVSIFLNRLANQYRPLNK